ncbi:MAG: multidrug efflux SMR transporter [Rhodobacteraceae bacterium]|nr:multidrug efflux SMR transporter [Paracoccaceae bacterium]
MPTAYIYLIIAIVFETIGTSALQASQQFSKLGPSVIVVIAYGISFFLLGLSLKTIPVGIAYAIWSALGIVMIACIGWVIFGQTLDVAAVIGLSMIIGGVGVIHLFSNSVSH